MTPITLTLTPVFCDSLTVWGKVLKLETTENRSVAQQKSIAIQCDAIYQFQH